MCNLRNDQVLLARTPYNHHGFKQASESVSPHSDRGYLQDGIFLETKPSYDRMYVSAACCWASGLGCAYGCVLSERCKKVSHSHFLESALEL